jgi:hypothetical protein
MREFGSRWLPDEEACAEVDQIASLTRSSAAD